MLNHAPTSFDTAQEKFTAFLESVGYPRRVAWVEKSDILWYRNQLFLTPHLKNSGRTDASKAYVEGRATGFGIWLHAFSKLEDTMLATILVPKNIDEAERALVPTSGLKMSVSEQPLPARATSRLWWRIHSLGPQRSSDLFWTNYFNLS